MAFLDYLVQKRVITLEEADRVKHDGDGSDDEALAYLKEKGVAQGKIKDLQASYFNIPFRRVKLEDVSGEILKYIPEAAAKHYQFVPIGFTNGVLEVGIIDPDNIEARDALQFITSRLNIPYKLFLIPEEDFEELVEAYKGLKTEVRKALGELGEEGVVQISDEKEEKKETRYVEDTPITKIVSVILRHSTEGNASDVHIEHTGEKIRVRFRVDGVLYTSLLLPVAVYSAVVARIKVLAKLRLDEKRKPQDGSFSAMVEGRKVDFRVSTFPTHYGEKVVLRILDPGKGVKKLEETGLSEANIEIIRQAIKRPYGIILLTGPTGSGKSSTLYAMINEINRESYNVVSLEDPVEYNISGMSQSQVHPEIGYTFAQGLRHILRQDPDIIMVGEIRDKETAQLAIHAALTGHLVFSTLHTNNAAGVVPRLIDMGVDPYLIAPTLVLAVAQRLAKVICPPSKKKVPIEGALKVMIEKGLEDSPEAFRKKITEQAYVHEAVPSEDCQGGTRGRVGIFEILEIDKELKKIILEKPTETEIRSAARKNGMLTMKEDALLKSMEGIVSIQEVNRFN